MVIAGSLGTGEGRFLFSNINNHVPSAPGFISALPRFSKLERNMQDPLDTPHDAITVKLYDLERGIINVISAKERSTGIESWPEIGIDDDDDGLCEGCDFCRYHDIDCECD